jgi:hypothetical protein
MAGIRQNGREQDQCVVAGSNPADPRAAAPFGRTRKATDDDGTHPRAGQGGGELCDQYAHVWAASVRAVR